MTSTYALVRQGQTALDVAAAAVALAPILGQVRADLQRDLVERPGILAAELPEEVAKEAAAALQQLGVEVCILPQQEVVALPPIIPVRRGKLLAEGFQFADAHVTKLAAWKEIIYFDAVQVQTAKDVVAHEPDEYYATSHLGYFKYPGAKYPGAVHVELKTDWQAFLDVVCHEPWACLRIDRNDFRFLESGLPMHATPTENFLALVLAFKTRCDLHVAGPGVELLFNAKPAMQQRVASMRRYENLLQWRLTMRLRGS